MMEIFLKILNMSLTASYVAVVVIVVRFLLRKTPKIYSYALWLVVLFRALSPISFSSSLSLLGSFNINNTYIPEDIGMMPIPQVNTNIDPLDNVISNYLPASTPISSINPMQVLIGVGVIIWVLGFSIMLIYSFYSYYKVNKKVQFATLVKDNIYETDLIKTPFVLGLINPKIYLPTNLQESECDYIINHEKVHIKRLDYIIKPLYFTALSLHWFNPLIWVSYFLMIKDMEMSCDERVMKECDIDIRSNYSSTLLNLSIKQNKIILPLGFGESNIKSRIKNIMNYRKPRFWIFIIGIIVGILASSLVSNPKGNAPEAKAKKFIQEYYTIVNTDIADMLYDPALMDSIASSDYEISKQGLTELRNNNEALLTKYDGLMTDHGFETASANRVMLEGELASRDNESKLYVFQTKLTKEEIQNSEDVRFRYNVAAVLIIKDKTVEVVNLDGNLVMKNVDGNWKVDRFSPSKGQLVNILKDGVPYLYIVNDSDAYIKKIEVQNKLQRRGAMNADGKPLKKGKKFIFDMNSVSNLNFFVTVLDEESVLSKKEFTEDFSNGKDVYLYIRKDQNGGIFLEEDSADGAVDSLDKLSNLINKILISNPKSDTDKAVAEEFLTTYYTIDNTDIVDMFYDTSLMDNSNIDTDGHGIAEIKGIDEAVNDKYGILMTEDALSRAAANRTILIGEITAREYGSRLKPENVKLWDVESSENGKIEYQYSISSKVIFSDGTEELVNLLGSLVMEEVEGVWKVSDFRPDRTELTKVLKFGKSFLYITNQSNAPIRKVEFSTEGNSSGAMNADNTDMKKDTRFSFEMIDAESLEYTIKLLDKDDKVLLEQSFTSDFSDGKEVQLIIKEDTEGNLFIESISISG